MGKKKKDIVDQMKPKFIEQGKANGHDPDILEKIWSDWENSRPMRSTNHMPLAIHGLLTKLAT